MASHHVFHRCLRHSVGWGCSLIIYYGGKRVSIHRLELPHDREDYAPSADELVRYRLDAIGVLTRLVESLQAFACQGWALLQGCIEARRYSCGEKLCDRHGVKRETSPGLQTLEA